jgi:integrase
MPAISFSLGTYVTVRPRQDGSCRVLFEVPPRHRPRDWPSTIPLPADSTLRKGDLGDEGEVAAIRRDAKALYAKLLYERDGRAVTDAASRRTMKQLVRHWQTSSAWNTEIKAKTRKTYQTYINHVLAWAEAVGNPDPTRLTRGHVEEALSLFDDRPVTRKHVRKVMRLVMERAISLGWRTDNPCDGVRLKTPKARFDVWEQADVDAYVAQAEAIGRQSIALAVLLEWEIGQRLTDLRGFRVGAEYDPLAGTFRFHQSKTDAEVVITVSARLRSLLAPACEGELFMFREETTGKAYTEERLSRAFGHVRKAVGGRYMQMRWLRHSCVVQLARAGCTTAEIAAVTGHSLSSVTSILENYLQRDSTVAANAQAKRGIR